MMTRVLFAAIVATFAFAHGMALQKMHATEHFDRSKSAPVISTGD